MKRRVWWVGSAVVLVALMVYLGLPMLQPRCSRWYGNVDFVSDRIADERYGGLDWSQLQRRFGEERTLEIREETWNEAIVEVGAKPFYCL